MMNRLIISISIAITIFSSCEKKEQLDVDNNLIVEKKVEEDSSYFVYVYNEKGQPVESASIWVSYADVGKAPLYLTDINGRAYLDLREKKRTKFHSLIIGKDGKSVSCFKSNIKSWPLKVVLK